MDYTDIPALDSVSQNQQDMANQNQQNANNQNQQNAERPEKGVILVDQTDAFVAPKDADTKDIPTIMDEMNSGTVKIWSLDVDKPAEDLVASNPVATKNADKTIQFIK
ncbi:hypothetical protein [Candidatus Phyllobacterium onerii]|uniref:hypothetical protein n=1 Tax=Candidatus Phyllobacterium onerii TaxID=3020828 RepID=UPI0023313C27|nr:hypothetical protein [Phyllobacterium sp. IY22]